jgi:hypothetical protein
MVNLIYTHTKQLQQLNNITTMIKLRNLLNESSPGFENRQVGDPLPTLDSVRAAYQAKLALQEADSFTAINKDSGEVSVFKSKDSRDAAVKAGTHDAKDDKAAKGGDSSAGKEVPKVNIFDKPKAEPKSDGMETVKSIAAKTGLRAQALAGWADENGVNLSKVSNDIDSKKLKPMDLMTAISGKPNNKYSKDIIAKYSQDGNQPHKEIEKAIKGMKGVSMDIKGDTIIVSNKAGDEFIYSMNDADDVADFITTIDDNEESSKEEPKSEPSKDSTGDRAGNQEVNKTVRAKAKKLGITPAKLGKDEYKLKMSQAAVEALTDANFHSEARALIAKLEGKPEWAEDPRKGEPDMSSPEWAEWNKNSVYSSKYYDADDATQELGTSASQESGWDGRDALDSIAFDLKMNGFKNLAAKLQSVIKESKSTRLKDLLPEGFVVMYKLKKDLKNINVGPAQAKYDDKSAAERFLKSVETKGGKGMIVSDKAPKSKIDIGI